MRRLQATIRVMRFFALAICLLQSSTAHANQSWIVAIQQRAAGAGTAPLEQWAKSIDTLTGGARVLSFVQQAPVVSARHIKSEIRAGRYACGAIDVGALTREGAIYGAAEIPFLATDNANLARLFDRWRPLLERRFTEDGLKLVMLLPGAPRGLLAPPGVRRIADLAALSVSAPGASGARLVEVIGARTTLEPPQAAFVSGDETWRRHEQMPNTVFVPLEGWRGAIAIVCRAELLEILPTPERAEMLATALDLEDAAWQPSGPKAMPTVNATADNHATIETATPARTLISGLARLGAQLAREWAIGAGPDGLELITGFDQPN